LLEKKIVIHGLDIDRVTRACLALRRLIFPFKWSGTCIPCCPSEIFENLLDAPVAILVGVSTTEIDISEHIKDDIVFVNLDNGRISNLKDFVSSFPFEKELIQETERLKNLKQYLIKNIPAILNPFGFQIASRANIEQPQSQVLNQTFMYTESQEDYSHRRYIEQSISEFTLSFMSRILNQYRNYIYQWQEFHSSQKHFLLSEMLDVEKFILFAMENVPTKSNFKVSSDEPWYHFFQALIRTQCFIKYIEECFLRGRKDHVLFFDEWCKNQPPPLQFEEVKNLDNIETVKILAQSNSEVQAPIKYDQGCFPKLTIENFQPASGSFDFVADGIKHITSNQDDWYLECFVRTPLERQAQIRRNQSYHASREVNFLWPYVLLFEKITIWLMLIPSLISFGIAPISIARTVHFLLTHRIFTDETISKLKDKKFAEIMQKYELSNDQIYIRIMFYLVVKHGLPSRYVKEIIDKHIQACNFDQMNAVTLGIYNEIILGRENEPDGEYSNGYSNWYVGVKKIRALTKQIELERTKKWWSERMKSENKEVTLHSPVENKFENGPLENGLLEDSVESRRDAFDQEKKSGLLAELDESKSSSLDRKNSIVLEEKFEIPEDNSHLMNVISQNLPSLDSLNSIDYSKELAELNIAASSIASDINSSVKQVFEDPSNFKLKMSKTLENIATPDRIKTIKSSLSSLSFSTPKKPKRPAPTSTPVRDVSVDTDKELQADMKNYHERIRRFHKESFRDGQGVSYVDIKATPCSLCPNCRILCYEEEVMAGWNEDDKCEETLCLKCDRTFIPELTITVSIKYRDGMSYKDYSQEQIQKEILTKSFTTKFLSPFVIRRNLEKLIESNPQMLHTPEINYLTDPKFVDEEPDLYWNLLYHFSDFIRLPIKMLDLFPKSQFWVDFSAEVQTKLGGILSNVFVFKRVYDNADLHSKFSNLPLYLHHLNKVILRSELKGNEVDENITASMLTTCAELVKDLDLTTPSLKILYTLESDRKIIERRSIYRELLFLTKTAYPAINEQKFNYEYYWQITAEPRANQHFRQDWTEIKEARDQLKSAGLDTKYKDRLPSGLENNLKKMFISEILSLI